MEILAENRFVITKSLFYEGMLRTSKESYGKSARKAILLFLALWLVLAAVSLLLRLSLAYVALEAFILGFVSLWLYFIVPRDKARRRFKILTNRYGTDLERVTRFFENRLEIDGSGVQTVIFYTQIKQVLRSKRLLILVSEENAGVLLALDGFVSGDDAVVCRLIGKSAATGISETGAE